MEYKSVAHICKFWIGGVASGQQIREFVTEFMRDFGGMFWLDDDSYDDYQMLHSEALDFITTEFLEFAGLTDADEDNDTVTMCENHAEEFLEATDEFMEKQITEFWTTVRGF